MPKEMKVSKINNDHVAWYQVPILWLSIVLSLVIIAGCGHFIWLSLQNARLQPGESHNTKLYLPNPSTSSSTQPSTQPSTQSETKTEQKKAQSNSSNNSTSVP